MCVSRSSLVATVPDKNAQHVLIFDSVQNGLGRNLDQVSYYITQWGNEARSYPRENLEGLHGLRWGRGLVFIPRKIEEETKNYNKETLPRVKPCVLWCTPLSSDVPAYPVLVDATLLPVSNGIVDDARVDSPVLDEELNVSGEFRSNRLPESPVVLDDINVVVSVDARPLLCWLSVSRDWYGIPYLERVLLVLRLSAKVTVPGRRGVFCIMRLCNMCWKLE